MSNYSNLTESQRRLLAAIREDVGHLLGDNTEKIMAEIEKLRQEQTKLHEEGQKREQAFMKRYMNDLRRHAFGLLGLAQVEDEEIDAWNEKRKGRH